MHTFKNNVLKTLLSGALLAVFGLSILGCPPPPPLRFRPGYADFWVDFYDYVRDPYGKTCEAYCANVVTFYGDIDFGCSSYPMVWSYAKNNWMSCSYTDSLGYVRYYEDIYYFYPGYIQEPMCYDASDEYTYPEPPTDTNMHQSTVLDRNTDGEYLLPDGEEVSEEDFDWDTLRDALLENPELLDEFRERLRAYIEENGIPEALLGNEPGAVRVSDILEGDPPEEEAQ